MYVGSSPDNALHKHHAAQLCVGLYATLRVREARSAPWLDARVVLIPPDRPHEINAGTAPILVIYWEPQSQDYPFEDCGPTVQAFPVNAHGLSALVTLGPDRSDPTQAWARCVSALGLTGGQSNKDLDPRVAATLERIRSAPAESHTLQSLAAAVHLSPSRLRHVFSEQVGVALRRFVVWTRVRHAVRLALTGASLTEAAHAAGFADAAHMSHTFRRMFGFAPSVLFAPNVPKRVFLVEDGD